MWSALVTTAPTRTNVASMARIRGWKTRLQPMVARAAMATNAW